MAINEAPNKKTEDVIMCYLVRIWTPQEAGTDEYGATVEG
jgi:hypothetical protein